MILILFKHSNKNKLYLLKAKSMKNFVIKRTIMSRLHMAKQSVKFIAHQSYSTRVACKVDKKLANDGTGNHTHVAKQSCILTNCENKDCPSLCSTPDKFRVTGHNTHKPPVGRMARFVAETDANGSQKAQYFVPTNKKIEITEQEKQQQYGNKIKPDAKQQIFIDQHSDKYDE